MCHATRGSASSFPICGLFILSYCTTPLFYSSAWNTQKGNEHAAVIKTLKEEKSLAELRASKV